MYQSNTKCTFDVDKAVLEDGIRPSCRVLHVIDQRVDRLETVGLQRRVHLSLHELLLELPFRLHLFVEILALWCWEGSTLIK